MTDPRAAAPADPLDPLPGAKARVSGIGKQRSQSGGKGESPGRVPTLAAIIDRAAAA